MSYSTHDWQNFPTPTEDTWSDVKTPAIGRHFAVGITRVLDTRAISNPQFSNEPCSGPVPPVNPLQGLGVKQVAIVQGIDSGGLVWQRYYHGSNGAAATSLACVARAIHVSLAATDNDTRVVICGETYDPTLPGAQAVLPSPPPNASGFIAAYDGRGDFLWSYHLFGADPLATTIATDVSVRWDQAAGTDVITYCGVSSTSNVVAGTPMQPVLPFASPTQLGGCGGYAGGLGSTNSGWDGFVGRIATPHAPAAAPQQPVFHSIFGGGTDEGLFGLVELDQNGDRFAVVGSVDNGTTSGSSVECPLTRPYFAAPPALCLASTPTSIFGLLAVFDARPTALNNPLVLERSTLIGNAGQTTIANDVAYQGSYLFVVGSTGDPNLASTLGNTGYLNQVTGPGPHGFIVSSANSGQDFRHGSYFTVGDESNCVGVAAWPEYPDHLAVVGWVDRSSPPSQRKIEVASLFVDTPASPTLLRLRNVVVSASGAGIEEPGYRRAGGLVDAWITAGLPAVATVGGGIAVDPLGLVTVVGSTLGSIDYPVVGGLNPQANHSQDPDGVRTIVDMLPIGVSRTDGTGQSVPAGAWNLAAGFSGRTTTNCASPISQIFLDYEGPSPSGGATVNLLIDRPPPLGAIHGGILQFGFPGGQQDPLLVPGTPCPLGSTSFCPDLLWPFGAGVEAWTNGSTPTILTYGPVGASIRQPIGPLPLGSGYQFSVQLISLLAPPCASNTYAASPALIISY